MKPPVVSLLLVADDDAAALAVTVGTVFRDPSDDRCELVLVNAGESAVVADPAQVAPPGRLQVVPGPAPGDPLGARALALAQGLDAATGAFVGVLGAGDIVEAGVLAAMIDYLARRPSVDVLYTDEQWPSAGASGIFTKPGWNPEYLLGLPYLGRLCLVRRELLMRTGGFRAGTPGVEEWDAHLRVTETGAVVEHIPAVGVTRPVEPAVTRSSRRAAVTIVADHFRRAATAAEVEAAEVPGSARAWRTIVDQPLVSVIVPTIGTRRTVRGQDVRLITQCVRSLLERTTYQHWELVLVPGESTPPGVIEEVAALAGDRLRVAPVTGPFNFSGSINEGARLARGELLMLLNDDTEVIEPRWLERMVGVARDPAIGVVGAKLLFEDARIQHIGVIHNDSWEPAHAFEFTAGTDHFGMATLDMDFRAVTGACLLTRRELFVSLGGLTTELPLNYNDVDYCFKVISSGLRVVSTPFARLHHYESSTRDSHLEPFETAYLRTHWRALAYTDPYSNLRTVR